MKNRRILLGAASVAAVTALVCTVAVTRAPRLAATRAGIDPGDGTRADLRRAAARPDASPKVRQNLAMILGLQGRMDEAEHILRRELPPELAEKNLQWLRARASGAETAETARTWSSLGG